MIRMFMKLLRLLLKLALPLLAVAACCLVLLVYAEKTVAPADILHADAIVVLGAQVAPDGTPMRQLELRLESALELWKQHPCLIVVCGAQGTNEPDTEANVMAGWLSQKGVPGSMLLKEDASKNTRQNLVNAKSLLPQSAKNVVIVTSDYHLPRALSLARDIMGPSVTGEGSPILPQYWLRNHLRELGSWGKYLAEKWILGMK